MNRFRPATHPRQSRAAPGPALVGAPMPEATTFSVLVVEDDAMVRGWIELALEGSEFRLAGVARTATEAVELARRRHPSILLTDYRLRDALGTQLVRDLRLEGLAMPAVLMTASEEHGFNGLVRESGAQGTVLKTGSADELLAALRILVRDGRSFDTRHPPAGAGTGRAHPTGARDSPARRAGFDQPRDRRAARDRGGERQDAALPIVREARRTQASGSGGERAEPGSVVNGASAIGSGERPDEHLSCPAGSTARSSSSLPRRLNARGAR